MGGKSENHKPKMVRKLSQEKTSIVVGVTRPYLSGIENGKDFKLSPVQMRMVMEIYGFSSLEELIEAVQGLEGIQDLERRKKMLDFLLEEEHESP